MNKLKILHINTMDSFGGAAQVALSLLQHTETENHLVVSQKRTGNAKIIELKKNLPDKLLLLLNKISRRFGWLVSWRAFLSINNEFNFTFKKLSRLKEYREADIIHLHNLHGGYFDLDALVKIAATKKIVWTLHDMWAITGGEAYVFDNENYKKGIGFTPYIKDYPLMNPLVDRRQHFLEKKKRIYSTIHPSLTIVPVSQWLLNCFKEAYVYHPGLHLHLIYNGIDDTTFRYKKTRTWSKPRVLFFNIDIPFKGRHLFMNILETIKHEFDLHVIGQKINTDRSYTHHDYVSDRIALNAIYNEVDFLVFPSQAENFPLTVLEAMACGVCVIASDTGGIPEMLDRSCGYLFKNNDANSLLQTIEQSLSDLASAREKGMNAEKRVMDNFTLRKTCDHYLKLYQDILHHNAGDTSETRQSN